MEVTWLVYQQIIAAYAHPDPREGRTLLARVIDALRAAVPAGLEELATLRRTLQRRREDVLAYFTHRASNGPTEAIHGRLEALRRNALGFRNLINYRIRRCCTAEHSHSESGRAAKLAVLPGRDVVTLVRGSFSVDRYFAGAGVDSATRPSPGGAGATRLPGDTLLLPKACRGLALQGATTTREVSARLTDLEPSRGASRAQLRMLDPHALVDADVGDPPSEYP